MKTRCTSLFTFLLLLTACEDMWVDRPKESPPSPPYKPPSQPAKPPTESKVPSHLDGEWKFINTTCPNITIKEVDRTTAISISGYNGTTAVTFIINSTHYCTYLQGLKFEYPDEKQVRISVIGEITSDPKNQEYCIDASKLKVIFNPDFKGLHEIEFKKDILVLTNTFRPCEHELQQKDENN